MVVVGGGINGASTAFALTQMGVTSVAILDSTVPTAGASGKGDGILRTYYENPTEATLAMQSLETYRNWSDIVGGTCHYQDNGFIWIVGKSREKPVRANVRKIRELGGDLQLLDADQLTNLQPHMSPDGVALAVYEPHAGGGDAAAATRSLISAASKRGADLHTYTRVLSIRTEGDRVTGVESTAGRISAGAVVVAAGPWSAPLLGDIGIDVPVVATRCCTGRIYLPMFSNPVMNFIDEDLNIFMKVTEDGLAHISTRDMQHLRAVNPDNYDQEVPTRVIGDGITEISKRVPILSDAVKEKAWAGVDGATPDDKAILGPVPGIQGLHLCIGSTFKGFKVAPAVGRAVAEMVTGGASSTTIDVTSLSLDRFKHPGLKDFLPKDVTGITLA